MNESVEGGGLTVVPQHRAPRAARWRRSIATGASPALQLVLQLRNRRRLPDDVIDAVACSARRRRLTTVAVVVVLVVLKFDDDLIGEDAAVCLIRHRHINA